MAVGAVVLFGNCFFKFSSGLLTTENADRLLSVFKSRFELTPSHKQFDFNMTKQLVLHRQQGM